MRNHFTKSLPYQGTQITVEQTQFEIQSMLKQFGVKAIRWTDTPESLNGKSLPQLEIIVGSTLKGVEKEIGIRIKPVLLEKSVGSGSSRRFTGAPEQSMRLLYWWLKSKLEAVRYGLESIEQTLMNNVMINLPDGNTTTIGEAISNQLSLGSQSKYLLPDFEIKPVKQEVIRNAN